MVVVDASVVLSWLLADELDDFARETAERVLVEGATTPPIFPAEVANALANAARRDRITNADVAQRLERLDALPIVVDSGRLALNEETALAQKHKLTVYDACYLHLAMERQAPLLSRDGDLRRAALKEKVAIQ